MKTKDKPILFSAPMVRAVLRKVNPKTMTRRIVKNQFHTETEYVVQQRDKFVPIIGGYACGEYTCDFPQKCPYGNVGDRLWVRETFSEDLCWKHNPDEKDRIIYKADNFEHAFDIKWKPSIFMPRWASRITLEITNVKVERLQDITEEDAKKEGVFSLDAPIKTYQGWADSVHRTLFKELWNSINGKGAWDANPFVWCIEFKILQNQ